MRKCPQAARLFGGHTPALVYRAHSTSRTGACPPRMCSIDESGRASSQGKVHDRRISGGPGVEMLSRCPPFRRSPPALVYRAHSTSRTGSLPSRMCCQYEPGRASLQGKVHDRRIPGGPGVEMLHAARLSGVLPPHSSIEHIRKAKPAASPS